MRLVVFNRWLWFLSGLNKSKMRSSVDISKNKWITNGDYWLGLLSLGCFSREKDSIILTRQSHEVSEKSSTILTMPENRLLDISL